jgi:hypothetical protein
MAAIPKSSWPWVRALLHSVYDQPDATSVHTQFDRVLDAVADNSRSWPSTSTPPAPRPELAPVVGEQTKCAHAATP